VSWHQGWNNGSVHIWFFKRVCQLGPKTGASEQGKQSLLLSGQLCRILHVHLIHSIFQTTIYLVYQEALRGVATCRLALR